MNSAFTGRCMNDAISNDHIVCTQSSADGSQGLPGACAEHPHKPTATATPYILIEHVTVGFVAWLRRTDHVFAR